jgi:hypothetical protein
MSKVQIIVSDCNSRIFYAIQTIHLQFYYAKRNKNMLLYVTFQMVYNYSAELCVTLYHLQTVRC